MLTLAISLSDSRMHRRCTQVLERAATDGTVLFDPELDPYASVAARQPEFDAWRCARAGQTLTAPDGSEHNLMDLALREARTPTAKSNKEAEQMTISLIEVSPSHESRASTHASTHIAREIAFAGYGNRCPEKDGGSQIGSGPLAQVPEWKERGRAGCGAP